MFGRLIILAFTKRWTYVVIGAILLIIGVVMFAGGHVIKPTEVSGTVSSVKDFSNSDGSYDHSEITLNETNTVYSFNMNDLQPKWPDQFVKDGKIDIWTDQGSTDAIAIQTYDQTDSNPTMYTTDLYRNPEHGVTNAHDSGIGFGVFGVLFLAFGLLWPIFPWGKKKQKQPAVAVAGYRAPVGIQTGFPQQPGYPPQQPGYPPQGAYPQQPLPGYPPQQPAYPSQPMYPPQQGAYPPQQAGQGYPPQQPGQDGWGQPPQQ